jgi:hypothetical protein
VRLSSISPLCSCSLLFSSAGCKYQLVSCAHPLDLYQVCLNHLDALRVLVRTSPEVSKLVENCVRNIDEMFAKMRVGDLNLLRYTLARFFQDRRVKVSLFLTDALQAQDGSMIHSHTGRLPLGADKPGTIRYFTDGKVSKEEVVPMPNSTEILPPAVGVDITKPGRPCELGTNLYAKDRRKKPHAQGGLLAAATSAAAGTKAAPAKVIGTGAGGGGNPPGGAAVFEADDAGKKAAKSELNLLAQMIGGGGGASKEKEKFSIVNLFPDTSLGGAAGASDDRAADFITFDQESHDARTNALREQFGGLDVGGAGGQDEDLLDLMDKDQSKYND